MTNSGVLRAGDFAAMQVGEQDAETGSQRPRWRSLRWRRKPTREGVSSASAGRSTCALSMRGDLVASCPKRLPLQPDGFEGFGLARKGLDPHDPSVAKRE